MKIVEFVDKHDLHENGTYSALYMSEESANELYTWCQDNDINCQSKDELHCTLIYSSFPLEKIKIFNDIKINASAKIVKWQLLGTALVLILDFPEAEALNQKMSDLGATSDFPDYICHSTVDPEHNSHNLPTQLPSFELQFDRVVVSELKDSE